MVMSGWERGFLLPLFCRILPFSSCESPSLRGPHIHSSASDSNHKLTLIFTTVLGNVESDNRDFAFILYAWLGYCCFSPLPWFSPFPGISPDFYTGHRSAPEPWDDNWCRSRRSHSGLVKRSDQGQVKIGVSLWKKRTLLSLPALRFIIFCSGILRGYIYHEPVTNARLSSTSADNSFVLYTYWWQWHVIEWGRRKAKPPIIVMLRMTSVWL